MGVPKYWRYAIGKDFCNSATGEPAQYVPGHPKRRNADEVHKLEFGKAGSSISVNADATLLAVAVRNDVHIYDCATRGLVKVVKGHTNTVEAVMWSPTNPKIFATSSSKPHRRLDEDDHEREKSEILIWNLDDVATAASDDVVDRVT